MTTLLLGALAGCGKASVDVPDGGFVGDRGPAEPPPGRPVLLAHPTPVPFPVATLRGEADGANRIIVEGGDNPLAKRINTDGTFCIDVPMSNPGDYAFVVTSQSPSGVLSEPSSPVPVVFDPSAPAPGPDYTTCTGAAPSACLGTIEICDNGRDDNCNGRMDGDDPDCSSCQDDLFEPNDDLTAPRVDPTRHESLILCEGDEDFYGVFVDEGNTLDARIFFYHAGGNLDMELLDPQGMSVTLAETTSDDEAIVHVATQTGEYKVRVFGEPNDYTLQLRVDPPGV